MNARVGPIVLTGAYLLVYWALAGFGRDLLFNHNVDADFTDDRVGAVLPYIRVAACAFAALVVVGNSSFDWALSRLPLVLAPYCLWTVLTVLWTDSTKDTLRGSLTLLAACGAVPILMHRLGVLRSASILLHIIVAVCFVSFIVARFFPEVGQHNAEDLAQGAHAGLWRGIFTHKNGLGPWAAYGTVLPLVYGGVGLRWPIRILGSASGLVCLIFAGSATSVALAAFCILLHCGFYASRRWSAGIAFIFAAGAAGVSLVGVEPFLSALGRSDNLSGRAAIWSFVWDYVRDGPWMGNGYATLGGAELRSREANLFAQAIPGSESGYLTLLLESGIVGCALFLFAYLVSLAKAVRWLHRATPRDRKAVEMYLIILISTLAEAVTESNAFIVTGYDGVLFFAALFAFATAPWPSSFARHKNPQSRQRDIASDPAFEKCGAKAETIGDYSCCQSPRRSPETLRRSHCA